MGKGFYTGLYCASTPANDYHSSYPAFLPRPDAGFGKVGCSWVEIKTGTSRPQNRSGVDDLARFVTNHSRGYEW